MKNTILYFAAAAGLISLAGCSQDEYLLSGEGTVALNTSISTDVKLAGSRASDQEALRQELGESLLLWISNEKGVVRKYEGLDNVPASVALLSGNYIAEAWAGDSVSASWDKRWFKAAVPFTVTAGSTDQVDIVCKIANVVASVEYAPDVDDVLKDYTLTISHSRGSLTFDAEHAADKAYFMMPSADKDLSWTLTGTKKADGATIFTRTSQLLNVQPGHEYVFKISCAVADEGEMGGGILDIVIDDKVIDAEDNIAIAVAPQIQGFRFDINQPIHCSLGNIGRRSVYITASSALTSVLVTGDALQHVFGEGHADFDAIAMQPEAEAQLKAAGILVDYLYDAEADASTMKLTFDEDFTDTYLTENDAEYRFDIKATDATGKSSTKTLVFKVSDVPYVPDPISIQAAPANVWAAFATITGKVLHADGLAEGYVIKVNCNGSTVDAIVDAEGNYSAKVAGLTPGTEYAAFATVQDAQGGTFTTPTVRFSTEAALQMPNSGFEDWQTSSSPYLIYPAGGQMWWDSGNTGSASLKKNVTTPNSTIKHSGNYSVELASQKVAFLGIGKFAAGNVFVGEYLKTDGTDGILGWGRAFTSRPTKVRGWYKYTPSAIEYNDGRSVPADIAAEYAIGKMDKGTVYVALMDSNTDPEYPNYPVVVKTKASDRQLFDKNGEHVIAYGEVVWTEASAGSDMVQFEITLDYRRTDIKPSYILLTGSASKGGDYFAGGNSTLYLDDIELVYE